jgi:hypothetical protein
MERSYTKVVREATGDRSCAKGVREATCDRRYTKGITLRINLRKAMYRKKGKKEIGEKNEKKTISIKLTEKIDND